MKKRISNFILVLILFAGFGLVLYPSFSEYWNSFHQSRAIANYAEVIANLDNEEYERMLLAAEEYNARAATRSNQYALTDAEMEEYNSLLDLNGTGMFGYIEIPSLKVNLPIYHGTSESVLQVAAGHVEWSSLPIGGESPHAVLSGHRGLPTARLFTDLDDLTYGDTFTITILNEVFTYSVDQILVVTPDNVESLRIIPGGDYVTLVTCTPYAINTHRLLVRGTRIENLVDTTLHFTSEAMQIDPLIVSASVAAPILLFLLLLVVFSGGKSQKKRDKIVEEYLGHKPASRAGSENDFPDDGGEDKKGRRKKKK